MSAEYGKAKARFDARMGRQGIHADAGPEGMIQYVEAKSLDPSLGFWYSKVEHFHAEMTARAAMVSALSDISFLRDEAAGDDVEPTPVRIVDRDGQPVGIYPQRQG
jgi:hypothetical protein